MINIAVIITSFNRREKTLSCLAHLFDASENSKLEIKLSVYLTDDGCTDGTAQAVREQFRDKDIYILQGTGELYWAGGMRFAWDKALKGDYDYYLLLNDDTYMISNSFNELFSTHTYCLEKFLKAGIYSGITCSKADPPVMTYGGSIWINKFLATTKVLDKSNAPQICDMTNANILLIPKSVVDAIGIFYERYRHGAADYDYTIMARKKGIPVLITADYCGRCDNDHPDRKSEAKKIISMSLQDRKAYFSHPLHSARDFLIFRKRTSPLRYPIVWIGRMLNIYFPKIYYSLDRY